MTTLLNPAAGALPTLRCPKCAAEMVMYERSGVIVDQCRECRGIYLDRGELERLIDLETASLAARAPSSPTRDADPPALQPAPGSRPVGSSRDDRANWYDHDDDSDEPHEGGRGWDDRRRPAKKRGFLGDLFEGFGD
jgi:Zn-finger nucleic acid-binding protein